MTVPAIIAVLAVIAAGLWFMTRGNGTSTAPLDWQAGPIINGVNYSSGVVVGADGSFNFPTSAPGVHYVTKAASLVGKTQLRMRYRIDGGAIFLGANDGKPVNIGPCLYFQRSGDDWSGTGPFEAYRWWATFAVPELVADGQVHEIVAPLSGKWTAVETSNSVSNPAAFADAIADCERVGFTWPSDTGFGHGCYASAPCRFTLVEFAVE